MSRIGIPNTYSFIPGAGNNVLPIGRPHYCLYEAFPNLMTMAAVGQDVCSPGKIPDLHRLVTTTRCDVFPIRRPAHRVYFFRVATIGCKTGDRGWSAFQVRRGPLSPVLQPIVATLKKYTR